MRHILALAIALCLIAGCAALPVPATSAESSGDSPDWTVHGSIRINGNGDFTAERGVISGAGTKGDPWVIGGLDINGTDHGCCIYIGNTTDFFVVRDCRLTSAAVCVSWPYYPNAGIALFNVSMGTLTGNTVSNNDYGIYMENCTYNSVIGNSVVSSRVTGIQLNRSDGNSVLQNSIEGCAEWCGIYLVYSCNNSIVENYVSDVHVTGIYLEFFSDCNYVGRNTVRETGYGIEVLLSSDNIITENSVRDTRMRWVPGFIDWYGGYGILLQMSSFNNSIHGNMIDGSERYGIYIVYYCNFNFVVNNTVSNNAVGIHIDSSVGNRIYFNNLMNNGLHAYDCGPNIWNDVYPYGGNYWDDYPGNDGFSGPDQNITGSDGIGDSPYDSIGGDAGAIDMFPLMSQYNGTHPHSDEPAAEIVEETRESEDTDVSESVQEMPAETEEASVTRTGPGLGFLFAIVAVSLLSSSMVVVMRRRSRKH